MISLVMCLYSWRKKSAAKKGSRHGCGWEEKEKRGKREERVRRAKERKRGWDSGGVRVVQSMDRKSRTRVREKRSEVEERSDEKRKGRGKNTRVST